MPSAYDRPQITVDPWGFELFDPATKTRVGHDGPRGRDRLVSAMRLNDGPVLLEAERIIVDPWGFELFDPATKTRVGNPPIWVNRLLAAAASDDTRPL